MKKSKKKKASKRKIRIFLALVIFGTVIASLSYNLLNNIINIKKMKEKKEDLSKQIVSLEREKEELETDIVKLKDPEYIAKYVRERYFYSKEGEVILRLPD